MNKREGVALVAILAMLVIFPSGIALAGTTCDSGEFCIWGGLAQTGDFWDPGVSDGNWPCCGGTGVQNDDQSIWNRESVGSVVYDGGNFTGVSMYCAIPGYNGNIHGNRDNSGNSHQLQGTSSCSGFAAPNNP